MARLSDVFGDRSGRIAEADSAVVIGLGRFGKSLALELMQYGTDVLGMDRDPELVQELNGELTQVVRADSTKEEVLRQLAVTEYDRIVVAIGADVQASILTCSVLLGMGAQAIWAKALGEQHGLILEQLGVHHVVYPEWEMGRRVAHLVRGSAMDYWEIDDGYSLVKAVVPSQLQQVALGETSIRQRYGITVSAYKGADGEWHNADNETVLSAGDTILMVGPTDRVEAFAQLR